MARRTAQRRRRGAREEVVGEELAASRDHHRLDDCRRPGRTTRPRNVRPHTTDRKTCAQFGRGVERAWSVLLE